MSMGSPVTPWGAANISAAAALVHEGRVFPLAHPFHPAIPQLVDGPGGHGIRLSHEVRAIPQSGGATLFSDRFTFHSHSGTHLDALGHWSSAGAMFGGASTASVFAADGLTSLGVEEAPPFFTRGVLVDVAAARGQESLPGGTVLGPDALEEALGRQGVDLESGDAVLLRTGWARKWTAPREYMAGAPGLSRKAAEWVCDLGCVVIGADQWSIDAVPSGTDENMPSHQVCLVERGVYLIENLNLERLAEEKVYTFLFVGLVPPFRGATGFPMQAIAVG